MTYLTYVAIAGAAATLFLWLRDARIFFRTDSRDTERQHTGE